MTGKDSKSKRCFTASRCLGILFCAFCFAPITIGFVNLNNCPKERMIPIFLVVLGFILQLLTALVYFCPEVADKVNTQAQQNRCERKKNEPHSEENNCDTGEQDEATDTPAARNWASWVKWAIVIVGFGWFIAGNVWVFRNQDYTEDISMRNGTEVPSSYCSYVYNYAYYIIIAEWIWFGLFILFLMGYFCYIVFVAPWHKSLPNKEDCEKVQETDVEKGKLQDVQLSGDVETAPVKVAALGGMWVLLVLSLEKIVVLGRKRTPLWN